MLRRSLTSLHPAVERMQYLRIAPRLGWIRPVPCAVCRLCPGARAAECVFDYDRVAPRPAGPVPRTLNVLIFEFDARRRHVRWTLPFVLNCYLLYVKRRQSGGRRAERAAKRAAAHGWAEQPAAASAGAGVTPGSTEAFDPHPASPGETAHATGFLSESSSLHLPQHRAPTPRLACRPADPER